ncbi:MAG: porin [Paucibacter sp.]|nr:porin [Roseateles sp.]
MSKADIAGARRRLTPLARLIGLAATVAIPLAALPAHADELSDLKAQIQLLNQRLADIEAKQSKAAAAPVAAAPVAPARSAALSTDQDGRPAKDDTALTLYDNGKSSLSIYGLVEATLSSVNHQTVTGGTVNGFQVAYFSGNRLGFDIQHALDVGQSWDMPDLKVIAKLEEEFELPTGNMDTANVSFNRDAWMGLYSSKLGKLTFGRQNTLTRDFTANWGDPYGGAEVTTKEGGYSNVNNFKQFIFYSAGASGTRYNSAIEWKKDLDGHWLVGAAYAFGSGGNGGSGDVGSGGPIAGDTSNGTGQAISVAYNKLDLGGAELNLNASYDRANKNQLIHEATLIGGNVVSGPWRFNAGFVHYTAEQGVHNSAGTRTDNSWTTSLSFRPNAFEYDLGYQVMKGQHAGFSGGGVTLNPFLGNTAGVTATADGSKRSLYGAIRYRLDRQTDFYFAADRFNVTGGWVVGDALGNGLHYGAGQTYKNETEFATGLRFKF